MAVKSHNTTVPILALLAACAAVRPSASLGLEESSVGEAAELTPVPEAAAAIPTPAPEAAEAPPEGTEAPATATEPESMLIHIGSGTPPNVAAALRLIEDGRQQMGRKAYERALDRFERAVAIDPTNAYGYYFLAQAHYLKTNYDQAIAFAGRAAVLSGRADQVWLGRIYSLQGAVFEDAGRYPDARKAYQSAIQADPNNLAARVGVARLSPE
jgi:tetratricopeptide (TPR) repeat protein